MKPLFVHDEITIDSIAHRYAKEIRRADVIDYDPEGQRIQSLVRAACWEAFELALPKDDRKTTHVTESKDVAFVLPGKPPAPSKEERPAELQYAGLCGLCKEIHDPRKHYDHAPVAVLERKFRKT